MHSLLMYLAVISFGPYMVGGDLGHPIRWDYYDLALSCDVGSQKCFLNRSVFPGKHCKDFSQSKEQTPLILRCIDNAAGSRIEAEFAPIKAERAPLASNSAIEPGTVRIENIPPTADLDDLPDFDDTDPEE